jgi:hypothetical protein
MPCPKAGPRAHGRATGKGGRGDGADDARHRGGGDGAALILAIAWLEGEDRAGAAGRAGPSC